MRTAKELHMINKRKADDIMDLCAEFSQVMEGYPIETCISALLTCVGGVCAQAADSKEEFCGAIAMAAECLAAQGTRLDATYGTH
jgi:hypothetical protein